MLAEIGRGGMGAVYRVRHAQTLVEYALKVINPGLGDELDRESVMRLRREAEILARLEPHPNLVRVFSAGKQGETLYCVMELVEGESLEDRRIKAGKMPPLEAARLIAEVARAVHAVHRQGVLHRDLKPDNVVVDARGTPRVLDFGLARDYTAGRLTQTGVAVGTPSYMAPEQIDPVVAGCPVGTYTDVYGLGGVLYALLTGRPPYEVQDPQVTMTAVLTSDPRRPRRVTTAIPPALEAICLKAMARDPRRRYHTPSALAADLERWMRGRAVTARPPSRIAGLVRRLLPGGRALQWVVLIASVLALVGGATALVVHGMGMLDRRRREEQVAALDARLDKAFWRSCAGDVEAIGLGIELCGELEAIAGRGDERVEERRRVLEGLARCRAGDEAFLGALSFEQSPWREHREAVTRVLVAAGRIVALAALVEREPALLDVGLVRGHLAEAVAGGGLRLSPGLAKLLLVAIDEADLAGVQTEAEGWSENEPRVLARCVQTLLLDADDPVRIDAAVSERVLARVQRSGPIAGLPPGAADRFAERAMHALTRVSERRLSEALRAVELGVLLRPAESPVRAKMADDLLHMAFARMMDPKEANESLLIGILPWRLGHVLFDRTPLVVLALADGQLVARADALLEDGLGAREAGVLGGILSILLDRAVPDHPDRAHERPRARREALRTYWRHVDALRRRARESRDVPPWIGGWLAEWLVRVWGELGEEPAFDEWLLGALDVDGAEGTTAALAATVDALYEDAFARDAALAPAARVWLHDAHLEWLMRSRGWAAERTLAMASEAMGRMAALAETPGVRFAGIDERRLRALIARVHRLVQERGKADPGHDEECELGAAIERLAERVRRADPRNARPDAMLGLHLIRHGRVDEALAVFARPRLEPARAAEWLETRLIGAGFLIELGRDDEAREALDATDRDELGEDEWLVGPLLLRADLWRRLGHTDRAAADARLAETIDRRGAR